MFLWWYNFRCSVFHEILTQENNQCVDYCSVHKNICNFGCSALFIILFYSRCLFRFIALLISLWENSGLPHCHRKRRSVFLSGNTMPKKSMHPFFIFITNEPLASPKTSEKAAVYFLSTRFNSHEIQNTRHKTRDTRRENLSWYLTHDRSDGVPGLPCIACSSSPFAWLRFYPLNPITRSCLVVQFFYLSIKFYM